MNSITFNMRLFLKTQKEQFKLEIASNSMNITSSEASNKQQLSLGNPCWIEISTDKNADSNISKDPGTGTVSIDHLDKVPDTSEYKELSVSTRLSIMADTQGLSIDGKNQYQNLYIQKAAKTGEYKVYVKANTTTKLRLATQKGA